MALGDKGKKIKIKRSRDATLSFAALSRDAGWSVRVSGLRQQNKAESEHSIASLPTKCTYATKGLAPI